MTTNHKRHKSLSRRKRVALMLVVCFVLSLGSSRLSAQTKPASEYALKAVFLFNFAKFVEWPDSAFADSLSPLVIGVLGQDPFGPDLDEVVRGERVNNRGLVIRRFQNVDEIDTCHVLFISDSENQRLKQILEQLLGRPILTVADDNGPEWNDTMIRLRKSNNKIRVTINVESADAAGLKISSKLLKLADLENPDHD